jgi:hypothetical protein
MGRRVTQIIHVAQRLTTTKFSCGFVLLCVVACRDRAVDAPLPRSPVETAIARDLTARFGVSAEVRCIVIAGVAGCRASVDGVRVPVVVENHRGEWKWSVDGAAIATAPIAARVRDELADLGVVQSVDCGKAVVVGTRVTCALGGGGAAFASVARDGRVSLEIAIDPAAAGVRREVAQDLTKTSQALAHGSGDEDDENSATVPP